MQDYTKLRVWQQAMDLTVDVYSVVNQFPADEKFALCSQMKRAVTSIPINIAEGCGRDTAKELAHFVHIAQGSASELECEATISERLGFLEETKAQCLREQIVELKRMLWNFEKKLRTEN